MSFLHAAAVCLYWAWTLIISAYVGSVITGLADGTVKGSGAFTYVIAVAFHQVFTLAVSVLLAWEQSRKKAFQWAASILAALCGACAAGFVLLPHYGSLFLSTLFGAITVMAPALLLCWAGKQNGATTVKVITP